MHGLLCSARAASRITRIARPNENDCAALSERLPSYYLRIRRRSGISGDSIVRKDTVCHVRIITSKIRLRQK